MTADRWTADVISHPRHAAFDRVSLRGPKLDEFAHDLIERLASDLFDEFCEYVAARNAVKASFEEGGATQYQLDQVADAWDELSGEIDSGLLLRPAESQIVAGVLDEAFGRVGIERRAA